MPPSVMTKGTQCHTFGLESMSLVAREGTLAGRTAYVVPFVETEGSLFLKTVFPSRRDTRRYLRTDKLDA
jgi:hypothetical protein